MYLNIQVLRHMQMPSPATPLNGDGIYPYLSLVTGHTKTSLLL